MGEYLRECLENGNELGLLRGTKDMDRWTLSQRLAFEYIIIRYNAPEVPLSLR